MLNELTRLQRGACEWCDCKKFKFYSGDIRYKCKCNHGDVWHPRIPKKFPSVNSKYKTKDKFINLMKPLIQLFNKKPETYNSKECPICLETIKNLVVINCGHSFCEKCIKNINITCPMCREYITAKIKVY